MNSPMSDAPLPTTDIQALMAFGFKDLPNGEYLLLTVGCGKAAAAKSWLGQLVDPGAELVVSVDTIAERQAVRRQRLVTVAVSHEGLLALGLRPSASQPFPSTFADGMGQADRARLLGDDNAESWRWADCAVSDDPEKRAQCQVVHLLVAHYWADAVNGHSCPLLDFDTLTGAGLHMRRVAADPDCFRGDHAVEHFGFRDGISQPTVAGLRDDLEREYGDAVGEQRVVLARDRIAAGEFLLGWGNEYGEPSYAPNLDGYPGTQPFAQAGSYIAVRQIRQDLAAFRAFEADHAKTAPRRPDGASIGERMIGRRRDGTPLCPFNAGNIDDFGYFAADLEGYGCPRGAHMRRANPRDSLGHDAEAGDASARRHRLLRRGRSYVENGEQGLFFMALNADLDRQFAFIQQRWIANPRFGDLAGEGDPLLGQKDRAFTIQDPLLSERVTGLPRFTHVVGGGYFLMPTLSALRCMAAATQAET